MNASGNAISLAPLAAASSIRAIVFLIEASRSSQAGAACTTATRYFGCSSPMAPSLSWHRRQAFPVDRRWSPMQSVVPGRERPRSTAKEQKFDCRRGDPAARYGFGLRQSRFGGPRHRCDRSGHMPIQFTTDGVPGSRRLALWQDIVCDVYVQLDCKSDLGNAFAGSVTRAQLGRASCSEVSSQRQHVFRTPSRIARAHEEFILIALGRHGLGGVMQDGRETLIHPGEFAIYDTTRPYELHFDDAFSQTILQVPRDMLLRRLAGTEPLTAIAFGCDRPLQKLAHDFVYQLCQSADQIA